MHTEERLQRSGCPVRALVVGTMVLVAGLAGCSGDSDDASLSVAQLRDLIEADPVTNVRMVTRADLEGELMASSNATMVAERETKRTRLVLEATEEFGAPSMDQVTIDSTVYVRYGGAQKWTRIDVADDLVENLDSANGQMGVTDMLPFVDGDLHAEGTETEDGQSFEVYQGDANWSAYLEATEGTDDFLRAMWEKLPTDVEMDLGFTALVDETGALHELDLTVEMTHEGETMRIVIAMTLLDAEGVEPVEAPGAGDVGETVSVSTLEEFKQVTARLVQDA